MKSKIAVLFLIVLLCLTSGCNNTSHMKKPDAVTVIPKDTFRDKIWGLPAADLLGVGRATQRVLDSYRDLWV